MPCYQNFLSFIQERFNFLVFSKLSVFVVRTLGSKISEILNLKQNITSLSNKLDTSEMTFGLLRYSLCTKLKLPINIRNSFKVDIPYYISRKPLFNETVRWTSTKVTTKQTKQLLSKSKVLRLYSLVKPEKNRLICK